MGMSSSTGSSAPSSSAGGMGQLDQIATTLRTKNEEIDRGKAQIDQLQRRAASADEDKKKAKDALEALETKYSEVVKQNASLKHTVENLNSTVDKLMAEKHNRDEMLSTAEAQVKQLKQEMEAARENYAHVLVKANIAHRDALQHIAEGGQPSASGGSSSPHLQIEAARKLINPQHGSQSAPAFGSSHHDQGSSSGVRATSTVTQHQGQYQGGASADSMDLDERRRDDGSDLHTHQATRQ